MSCCSTAEREESKAARAELRDGAASDDEDEIIEVEETVEECVEIIEEPCS